MFIIVIFVVYTTKWKELKGVIEEFVVNNIIWW